MQTYLTHIGYNKTLKALSDDDLKQQRLDARNILQILLDDGHSYRNHHPAIAMWHGYERSLCNYGASACYQWRIVRRNNCALYPFFGLQGRKMAVQNLPNDLPPWLEDAWIMRSHRSNLIRQDPKRYAPLWPNTPANMPYLWAQNDSEWPGGYRLAISDADRVRVLDRGTRAIPSGLELNEVNNNIQVLKEFR